MGKMILDDLHKRLERLDEDADLMIDNDDRYQMVIVGGSAFILLGKLTNREAQVLERIVAGRLNKQIADDLNISIKTVEAHRANIMEKLGANTVADLLKVALGSNTIKS